MIETHVAIQGVCAWPRMKRLEDGSLVAMIWNQPCHGRWIGDLDCWASEDDGATWRFRGRVAERDGKRNRMNCAAGIAPSGDLIVLCSGYENCGPVGADPPAERICVRALICRSSDGGRTWQRSDNFPDPPADTRVKAEALIPFGNIEIADDGSFCAAAYLKKDQERECYFFRSRDDGQTWDDIVMLNPLGNETCVLHVGSGRWLAASRNNLRGKGTHMELMVSVDDGATWQRTMHLTLPRQATGDLTLLSDGRVLLSYGNRILNGCGVEVRFSDDLGESFGAPIRIADTPSGDSGYPSTVELPDGRAVTAYYAKVSHDYHYEMRVAHWRPSDYHTRGTLISGLPSLPNKILK